MLESSQLYQRWIGALSDLGSDPGLLNSFAQLREVVSEQAKFIIHVFPGYTPHDATRHLEQLFPLADRVLGTELFEKLNAAELSLLVFALYSHDWGMAVSEEECAAIDGTKTVADVVLIPEEPRRFHSFRDEATALGRTDSQMWEEYLRLTHAHRSGCRLRRVLASRSQSFAEMVARVAEGHVLDIRDIRDPERYPLQTALLGQVANVAAVATYVRLVDLLDIAEDRTPFALWAVVSPRDPVSQIEWKKHRSLAPVAVNEQANVRQVVVSGTTDSSDVFAALADLRSWVDTQFAESVGVLRHIGNQYELSLDSAIKWDIKASGFEPVLLRFDFDRSAALALLSTEVYGRKKLTFVRELLQNSVDAIDTRVELLKQSGASLEGQISIEIITSPTCIQIRWRDNGVGMDRYVLENYFAKIGRSWYQSKDFRKHSFVHDPISKFGVGLLSCFAVSPSLTVITRRDPSLAKDPHGWGVHIPSRDGHFAVKIDEQVPVGTTLVLELQRIGTDISAAEVANAVKQIALMIRYKILLSIDGCIEVIEPSDPNDVKRFPSIRVSSLDENAMALLDSLTIHLSHHYRSPDGGYEAFFSVVLPRDVSSITALKHDGWRLGDDDIRFDDFIVEHPPALLLKGIVAHVEHRSSRGLGGSVCLNILKPSLVQPDLSRSHVDVSAVDQAELWNAVGPAVREALGPQPSSIQDRVEVLSVARQIVRVPTENLSHIVPLDRWPVWTLEAGAGLLWRDAPLILNSDQIVEAPQELGYLLDDHFELGSRHARRWRGVTCFVVMQHSSKWWWSSATKLVLNILKKKGLVPTDLLLVTAGDGDDVPLACRVWRQPKHNRPVERISLTDLLREWRNDPMLEDPDILQYSFQKVSRGSEKTPVLVRFPPGMESVAAIGSLYWNQNNATIRRVVEVLLELAERFWRGTLSAPSQRAFEYLNGTAYLGYVAPARHSGSRAAIDRYRELLVLAKQEGIPTPSPLGPEDFLAGSVGKYWNPYHYPIGSWGETDEPMVGTAWPRP